MKDDYDLNWWEEHTVPVSEPDWDSLNIWIDRAKGNRTYKEEGEICGCSQAMFTRIRKHRIKGRLKLKNLYSFAKNENWDNPYTGNDDFNRTDYIMLRLVIANGMDVIKEDGFKLFDKDSHLKELKDIFLLSLVNYGYAFNFIPNRNVYDSDDIHLAVKGIAPIGFRGDYLHINGRNPYYYKMILCGSESDSSKDHWVYYNSEQSMFSSNDFLQDDYTLRREVEYYVRDDLTYFFVDSKNPELVKNVRMMYIFEDEKMCDAFYHLIDTFDVNNTVSVVLLDINNKSVVSERLVKGRDKDDDLPLFS